MALPTDPTPSAWDDERWPDFKAAELSCPCCGEIVIDPAALDALQRLRSTLGAPLRVDSGHRCAKHNADVGGAARSRHLGGGAFDVSVVGHDRKSLYVNAIAAGFSGFGFMRNALHCDMRPVPASWNYGPESVSAWIGIIPPGTNTYRAAH